MVQLNFDARQHAPLDNDPVPEGWYNFIIDDSSSAPTKDGNPNHLRLNIRFSVMDGPHQGRKVFTGLNIRHTNVQTMEMANRELSAICAAVGLPYVQDTQQLHNIPIKGRVKVRKDPTGQYDDQAEIKSYKPANFVVPGVLNQPGAAAAPQQPAPTAPSGWGGPQQQPAPQQYAQQPAPQQYAPQGNPAAPQQMPQQPPNGGWQQPQQAQPWGQPQQPVQQAPQPVPQHQTVVPPVQFAEPQPQPPQQSAPVGFAVPPQQQAPQQAPQPAPNPQAAAAQQAAPPWVRQQG